MLKKLTYNNNSYHFKPPGFKKIYIVILFYLMIISPALAEELITPIPLNPVFNKEKAVLGKKLFSDPILSKDNTISCESCHKLDGGGVDGLQFSIGVNEKRGNINSPTVFNSFHNLAQFWDGRARDLKEQVMDPIVNPVEMASTFKEVITKLSKIPSYKREFKAIYKDGITEDNIADAIAEFEKALITANSRFDKYLRGDKDALTKDEVEGYELFKSKGCISCHNGVNIGGNMYQKFGVMKEYRDETNQLGRYNVTKNEVDKYYFKVPTLRNIELTAPYFHDSSEKCIKKAVEIMPEHQLGRQIKDDEIEKIVMFLKTLTGELPAILKK